MLRSRRDGDAGCDTLGVGHRPLKRLHAPHGSAAYREQSRDAQAVEQLLLRPDHVGDCDHRKAERIFGAGGWVYAGRAGAPLAASDHVGADQKGCPND